MKTLEPLRESEKMETLTGMTAEDEAIFAAFRGATWASFEEFAFWSDRTDANNARENVRSAAAFKEWQEEVAINADMRRREGAWEDAGCPR